MILLGVCIDINIESKELDWEAVNDTYENPVDMYRENLIRQCDAYLNVYPPPEHAIRAIKDGMLYIGWDITEEVRSNGHGVKDYEKYQSIFNRELRIFLLSQ